MTWSLFRADFAVALSRAVGPTQRADILAVGAAGRVRGPVTCARGARARCAVVCRVAWLCVTSSGHRRSGWLIGEDASDGKRRYYWSNFGPEVVLERMVEYAHRRHWVETSRRPKVCWAGTSIRGGCGRAFTGTR